MRGVWLFFFMLVAQVCNAQWIRAKADSSFAYHITSPYVMDQQGDTIFYCSGNIVYEGANADRERIYLLIAGNKKSKGGEVDLYVPGKTTPSMVATTDELVDYYTEQRLLYYSGKKQAHQFRNAFNDSVLVTMDTVPEGNLMYLMMYRTAQYFAASLQPAKTRMPEGDAAAMRGFIKKAWGNQMASEWEWDGQILKLRWNGDLRRQWRFDGTTIERAWSSDINAEYAWEDNVLRPVWRSSSRNDEWVYDGQVMKPAYLADQRMIYRADGNRIKQQFGNDINSEWMIEGQLPVPIIIFVISGMAFH